MGDSGITDIVAYQFRLYCPLTAEVVVVTVDGE